MSKNNTKTAVEDSTTAVNLETTNPVVIENLTPVVPETPTLVVDDKLKDGIYLPETKAANSEILFAMSVEENKNTMSVASEVNNIDVTDHKIVDPNIFEYNGKNYKLSDRVEKLQIDGRVYLRKDILTNKEIMTSLIVGNSPFIKKA